MLKQKKYFPALIVTVIIMSVFIILTVIRFKQPKIQYMQASWAYNYADIEEISKASDLIAIIRVDGKSSEYIDQGIPFTEYKTTIIDPIYNSTNNQEIVIKMTGCDNSSKHMEIADDPLLKPKEEFMIFAKENEDGTYTILSGPQGRLVYSDGTLNSLQMVNARIREYNPDTNIKIENADAEKLRNQIQGYLKVD